MLYVEFSPWWNIVIYQKLSESFIREFQDKLKWKMVSSHQKLSENFIREFQDKVHWASISEFQELSEDFISEFQDKVKWNKITKYQNLSKEFIEEFSLVVSKYNILKVVHYYGKTNWPIFILKKDPNKVVIGCSSFTKEEAIEAINKKYNGNEALDYINKVNECFNLK
jgi:hypothetical protein